MSERDKIVAFIRREADWQLSMKDGHQAAALTLAADRIEAGEHLKKPAPTIPASEWVKVSNVGH